MAWRLSAEYVLMVWYLGKHRVNFTFASFEAFIAVVSSQGLLVCNAVLCCSRIPTFQRSTLPPFLPEDGGNMDL
jgi:hypothetical protein